MSMRLFSTLLLSIAVCSTALISGAHAQTFLPTQSETSPSHISLKPAYPAPGDTVVAKLNAHMIYTPSARIVWKQDGVIVQEKLGGTEYTFVAGKVGKPINLEVIVYEESGDILRKTLSQTVGAVSIIWEGRTYTPPLYQGRALFSPDSEVVLQALPIIANGRGGFLDTKDMVFKWHLHGETNPRYTGQGLDSIVTKGKTPFIPLSASVQITDKSGTILAIGHTKVPMTFPSIVLYEGHPLVGLIRSKALPTPYIMRTNESTLFAEPYYMSTPTRTDPSLVYEWRVASQKITTPGKIVLRPQGNGAGSASIEATITHRTLINQRARGEASVRFQTTNSVSETTTTEQF